MSLSKISLALVEAYKKGYRVINGEVFNPKGSKIKTFLVGNSTRYHCFSVAVKGESGKRYSIKVHRMVAYQKFGEKIFHDNVLVRHLDNNSFNNLESNIELGSCADNSLDVPKEQRLQIAIYATAYNRKFSDEVMEEIRYKNKVLKISYSKLMSEYNISSKGTLSYIINNQYITKK